MILQNEIQHEDVASAYFTTTPGIDAEFPAVAARIGPATDVALMCGHADVPGACACASASSSM